MLESGLSNLLPVPGHVAELPLLGYISFDPVLNSPEDHLHENGLWANPSAENSAIDYCEENDEQHPGNESECEEVKVLRPENLPEQNELPLNDIEENEGLSVDFDPWSTKQEDEVEIAQVLSRLSVSSLWLGRENPLAFSLLIYGGNMVPKLFRIPRRTLLHMSFCTTD